MTIFPPFHRLGFGIFGISKTVCLVCRWCYNAEGKNFSRAPTVLHPPKKWSSPYLSCWCYEVKLHIAKSRCQCNAQTIDYMVSFWFCSMFSLCSLQVNRTIIGTLRFGWCRMSNSRPCSMIIDDEKKNILHLTVHGFEMYTTAMIITISEEGNWS